MYKWKQNESNYIMPYNSRTDVVCLLAEQYDTKSNLKLGGFRSQLHASYVSSHTEELLYNETHTHTHIYIYIYIVTIGLNKHTIYIYIVTINLNEHTSMMDLVKIELISLLIKFVICLVSIPFLSAEHFPYSCVCCKHCFSQVSIFVLSPFIEADS